MKTKAFLIVVCILLFGSVVLRAQKISENEAVKVKIEKAVESIDAAFKLEKSKRETIEAIFSDFYTGQQQLKNNLQRSNSGLAQGLAGQDFQSARKKNEVLLEERNTRLKNELNSDQYKKWKLEIEPALHKGGNKK